MKELRILLIVGCALIISQRSQNVAADDGGTGIPLRKLAGTYAEIIHSSFFFCLESIPPHAPAACGGAGVTGVPFTALAVGAYTSDVNGNICLTVTETDADSPLAAAQPTQLMSCIEQPKSQCMILPPAPVMAALPITLAARVTVRPSTAQEQQPLPLEPTTLWRPRAVSRLMRW